MAFLGREERSVSPVIGVILLVALTVVFASVAGVFFTGFEDKLSGHTANAKVSFNESPVGLEMVVDVITIEADVRLNGKTIGTIDQGDAGTSMLIPTAPGDRITIVSGDSTQSVLVDKTAEERNEIGDFIAYYDFEEGSGSTLVDRSGTGNDGTIHGATWGQDGSGGYLEFDGTNDDVTVSAIDSPEGLNTNVKEFTIAISYRPEKSSVNRQRELIEHIRGSGANKKNWFITTRWRQRPPGGPDEYKPPSAGPDEYKAQFKTGPGGACADCISGGVHRKNEKHVIVGTYDGKNSNIYVDGTHMESGTTSITDVSMGRMKIGQDAEGDYQHYKGKIYEIRLYYHEFDSKTIQQITSSMS